jgi:membrane protein
MRELARLTAASAWGGLVGFYESDNLTYAASLAYYSLVSLFPCLLLAFAVLGRITSDEGTRYAVLTFVLQYFPRQFDFIARQLEAFRANDLSLGLAGTLGLVWGAFGVFGAITTAVNYAWGFEQAPPRTFWRHKLMAFLMFLLAGLTLLVAMLLVSASHVVGATWFAGVLNRFPGLDVLSGLAVRSATTLLFIVVVGLVYYFVPNTKVRFRDVWFGAALTGLLWKGAIEGFSWYARDLTRFARINGSIAVVVVFLVWVYVQAAIVLYGVEFTAVYARLRREQSLR